MAHVPALNAIAHVPSLNISIRDIVQHNNWSSYWVRVHLDDIFVTVTHDPSIISYWIAQVRFLEVKAKPDRVVVSVRTEWKSIRGVNGQNRRADILQLCTKNHCLIYEICHSNGNIPVELHEFLGDNRFTFVGVDMVNVLETLRTNYGIVLGERVFDLTNYYRLEEDNDPLPFHTIREVCRQVLRRNYSRPHLVYSEWDAISLSSLLVKYACADVVICYKAGVSLGVWNHPAPPRNQRAADN